LFATAARAQESVEQAREFYAIMLKYDAAGTGLVQSQPTGSPETTRDRLPVLDPDLTVRFADRSFGDAFTVTPKDTLCEQEGQQ
jgi:hypothetical protein